MFSAVALIFGIFAVLMIISAIRLSVKKKRAGIDGKVRDNDLDGKGQVYQNKETGVAAKPDVVIDLDERRKKVVEVKNTVCKTRTPYKADVIQLAAEMEATGAREGEIRYRNKTFVVNLTERLKEELRGIIAEMEKSNAFGTPPKGTPSKKKCAACDFSDECPDAALQGSGA